MTRDSAILACFAVVAVASGCDQRVAPLRRVEPEVIQVVSQPCSDLQAACPSASVSCDSESVGACVSAAVASFGGYCDIANGDEPCVNGELTDDYRAYCRVQACFGTAEADCLAEGLATCQGCNDIDDLQKDCPGWATSADRETCQSLNEPQAACIADILAELYETGDQCVSWRQPIKCVAGHVSLEGYASCAIQECLGLTTLEECAETYAVLCSWMQ